MRLVQRILRFTILLAVAGLASLFAGPGQTSIRPGELWPDNRGLHVQAHGGGILKLGETYYWFGEDRGDEKPGARTLTRAVSCYASTDLLHWTFRHRIVDGGPPEADLAAPYILERPKVFHNARTGKFVLYAHLDSPNYKYARIGVYVSDTVDGNYTFVHSFRPLGQESRDIGQFVDDDGSAYLIFEARPTKGFFIASLSDDYLTVKKEVCFIPSRLEGGALVKHDGLYYIVGSWMTGWDANPNQYATARSLKGPWSEFKDIAPPKTNTYGSQSTLLLKVVGSKKTSVVFMGDLWHPKNQPDSRYLWMPVEIGKGHLWLPKPQPWTIDVKTGVTTWVP